MADFRSKFLEFYNVLKSELLQDPAFEHNEDSRQRVEWMLDYDVPRGKFNRGLSVIDSYKLLKEGQELSNEEFVLACVLGWCIEWLQAYFLILDDVTDSSLTRRGQPCWFRPPKVGMIAVNDSLLLRNYIPRILKKHCRGKPYYIDLLDLFNEVEFQTTSGQMIDLITTLEGEKDLSKYSLSLHNRIVQYKTAYYSFYSPENYGKADEGCVKKVKELYELLALQDAFAEYESRSHEKLLKSIEAHPSAAVQAVLGSFLAKIYNGQK